MSLVTAATTPVLFSSLSRLQLDATGFKNMFFRFQKVVGLFIIPLGVGIYLFRNLLTSILLGNQWMEAANFIGLWGLTSAITIVFAHYCSEVYRAKGKPKLSVLAQVLHIIFLVPAVFYAVRYGFDVLCETRAWIRLQLVVVNLIILYSLVKISFFSMFRNVYPSLLASLVMAGIILFLPQEKCDGVTNVLYLLIAVIIYVCVILCFSRERMILLNLRSIIKK